MKKTAVLFVCLGNICRSPTAHGVFQAKVDAANLSSLITVDSCGTGDWHIGHAPDTRSQAVALKRGYDLSSLSARQLLITDYQRFDYIFAMDEENLRNIHSKFAEVDHSQLSGKQKSPTIALFLSYAFRNNSEGDEIKVHSGQAQLSAAAQKQYLIAKQHDFAVPDPYYGGEEGFEQVYDLVESACDELLKKIRPHYHLI